MMIMKDHLNKLVCLKCILHDSRFKNRGIGGVNGKFHLVFILFVRSCEFINLYFKSSNTRIFGIYTIFHVSTDLRIPRSRFSHFLAFYDPGFRVSLFLVAETASVFNSDDEGTLSEKCGKCALRFCRPEHYSFERVTGIDIVIILHTVKLPSK